MNVKHIFNSHTTPPHTHTHKVLGVQEVDGIKEMPLERGFFNFEVSESLLQMHRRVINLNVSQQYRLD